MKAGRTKTLHGHGAGHPHERLLLKVPRVLHLGGVRGVELELVARTYLWLAGLPMKLNDLKVSLTQQILQSNDEERLRMVVDILEERAPFRLSARQKAELDKNIAANEAGESECCTWNEVQAYARSKS